MLQSARGQEVLPARVCRAQVWAAAVPAVAAAPRLPAADAAAEGLAAVAVGGGGGGRRSDIALKHDVVLLGHLDNGLGYYRFSYLGSDKAYVGRHRAGSAGGHAGRGDARRRWLSPGHYDRLGIKFLTYKDWLAAGAQIPTRARM